MLLTVLLLEGRRGRLYVWLLYICIGRDSPAAPPVGGASIVMGACRLRRAGIAVGMGAGGIADLALDRSVRRMKSRVLADEIRAWCRSCGAVGWKAGCAGPERAVEPIAGDRSRVGTFRG
jgi:hypothetical protein